MNSPREPTSSRSTARRAAALKEQIKRDGKEKLQSGKQTAADHIADVADAIDVAGARLERTQPTLGGYATRLAQGIGDLATRLRDGSIEDLSRDARQFATRNPGMFLLGSAAVGIVLARFLKASGERSANLSADARESDSASAFAGTHSSDLSDLENGYADNDDGYVDSGHDDSRAENRASPATESMDEVAGYRSGVDSGANPRSARRPHGSRTDGGV